MTITRAVLVLEPAAPDDPSGRARAVSPPRTNGDRQAAASRPRSRSRRRSEPARGGRCRPRRATERRGECSERSPTSSLSTPRTASSDSAQRGDGAKPRALFRLEVTADGPIWPLGAPRARRATYSQIPDHYAHAGNSGIPMMGDPGLEPGNLFLIRKTFCRLQSSQLELNPCKRVQQHARKTTGDDWALQAGGPIVAPRPQFEGTASHGPVAVIEPTIRSSPDAAEAGRCAPAGIASTAASLGAWSRSSITWPWVPRGARAAVSSWRATFSPALATLPRRHRFPFAADGGGAAKKPVPPRPISRQANC